MKDIAVLVAVAMVLLALSASPLPARERQQERAWLIKSGFLFNFARFTTWPTSTASSAMTTSETMAFDVCILTNDDKRYGVFQSSLEKASLRGLPIKVRRAFALEEARGCNMLYVADDVDGQQIPAWREHPSWRHTLVIGCGRGFIDDGGDMYLYEHRNKLRFGVNLKACRQKGFKMSSKMLKLGTIVNR